MVDPSQLNTEHPYAWVKIVRAMSSGLEPLTILGAVRRLEGMYPEATPRQRAALGLAGDIVERERETR